jgi:hypothetical protein
MTEKLPARIDTLCQILAGIVTRTDAEAAAGIPTDIELTPIPVEEFDRLASANGAQYAALVETEARRLVIKYVEVYDG